MTQDRMNLTDGRDLSSLSWLGAGSSGTPGVTFVVSCSSLDAFWRIVSVHFEDSSSSISEEHTVLVGPHGCNSCVAQCADGPPDILMLIPQGAVEPHVDWTGILTGPAA
jgi:hypothetical protein